MQVHAVPDAERVHDSLGRQLPWGFEYADSDHNQRRLPEEKGPFGKSTRGRLGKSRSKTATPARTVDQAKLENLRAIDDIFTAFKNESKSKESQTSPRKPGGGLAASQSAPNLDIGGANATAGAQQTVSGEPTPVILYGYGSDLQWAAIDHYEKVSNGFIYEEYERNPTQQRYNLSLSLHRSAAQRTLTKEALRKTNQFVGGHHWIKVTFDSPESAERACHYSPHVIHGYQVHAERYRGTGPNADVAFPATTGLFSSQTSSPNPSSTTLPAASQSQTSETASSATATASIPASTVQTTSSRSVAGARVGGVQGNQAHAIEPARAVASGAQREPARQPTLRIKNAKLGKMLSAEQALLPAAPLWQQTMRSVPVLGWVFGSGHEIIGNQVPRKADGAFDSDGASVYWKFWYMIDSCFGTDFCGVRGDEDD
ncbi:uncharacterized protein BDZ99DRAFT_508590 [Mytilinidion resinicola]|uniref:Nucleoporin NUP53 n=1 Tax=Mytilinidion resinicola TaxID=574789 RepID=A0A6A6YMG0_9PEZI|nr:uncharacterized protein BDZ99DRAFT_508590 [Mytilinidion resinicola]KAF2809980.1 hypothetical protein BDZ99DRAFT_508590 [Mytilinidion resinicola]